MYGGMPPHACPGSLCFSRIPTLHTQILTLVQGPENSSHSFHWGRLPTIQATPSSGEGSQQLLIPVQAPNTAHANLYTCTGSQQFKQFLTLVQAFDDSRTNPYACEGSQ
ncbi:hypothetical protein O181_023847 [Austropuccinia psidii MF-1]|uniref:Uncharacterized protein n=1 Tax=Austropuccinia psidii MF-1 TaxID=1389203 RepID=A0A9Q3CI44_9BASI|nr:hypothetical protein [Austropuccinia psidii MF-1]